MHAVSALGLAHHRAQTPWKCGPEISRPATAASSCCQLFIHQEKQMKQGFGLSFLLIGIGLLGLTISTASSDWFWQNPLPQGNDLWAASAPDANTIIAVGDLGTIVRSTDGGATWTASFGATTATLLALSFVDAYTGTAVGGSG